jgi:hypothetical protein
MSDNDDLYEKTLTIIQSNESLYDRWENQIAAHMSQKWSEAFAEAAEVSGSENPTVMEVADMGADKISDIESFLADLYEVFRTLAKGCQLNNHGNWC